MAIQLQPNGKAPMVFQAEVPPVKAILDDGTEVDLQQQTIDAFCARYGYQPTVPNPNDPSGPRIANPMTPFEFSNLQVIKFIQGIGKQGFVQAAEAAARNAALSIAEAAIQAAADLVALGEATAPATYTPPGTPAETQTGGTQ